MTATAARIGALRFPPTRARSTHPKPCSSANPLVVRLQNRGRIAVVRAAAIRVGAGAFLVVGGYGEWVRGIGPRWILAWLAERDVRVGINFRGNMSGTGTEARRSVARGRGRTANWQYMGILWVSLEYKYEHSMRGDWVDTIYVGHGSKKGRVSNPPLLGLDLCGDAGVMRRGCRRGLL